jgi:hypothetical protein
MLRSAVITLLAVPALALPAAAHAAVPTTLQADVGTKGRISLVEGVKARGEIKIVSCANTSPTAFVCKGTGTIFELTGKVVVRWKCPADKPCAKKAEGTLKSHRSTLALLHVKASVPTFQTRGSQFALVFDPVGE